MPAALASLQFIRSLRFDLKAALGLIIGGAPAVLIAAFIVKEMPLNAVRWLVVVVVLYTAATLLRSALTESREPDYPLLTRQRKLHAATSDGQLIARTATELWDEAKLGEAVRLIGVSVSALVPLREEQLELFGPRRPQVGPTLDAIRERFGAQVIGRAVSAPEKVTPSMRRKSGD